MRLRDLFKSNSIKEDATLKTVKDLQLLDDVWIKEDEEIYTGWIWDISRRCITVVYGEDLRDFRFQIPRPMNTTTIIQDNKILYCNKPNNDN